MKRLAVRLGMRCLLINNEFMFFEVLNDKIIVEIH